ncbi:MAG: DUF1156 domain-containing protein [Alphaproteobacteria bacterium]|nr:DUF1156 domain-containing protein [Alphaproteobacteria bacterium]MCB9797657.1 DUF1156 domain-containing protein [Alphaproteobacteria bacterium]
MTRHRKKLIEVALPLDAINRESGREKSIRHGHPSTLHLWWARRPLAACRAVLFGQLVDDPSSWPDQFPTEKDQDRERQRLFRLIEELVTWENSDNDVVLDAARLEIARSFARGRQADGEGDARDVAMLAQEVSANAVRAYLVDVVPPVHDPFAGGGSIPLEAQRLGLRAIATDLNPVAVLINKALIEIPPRFAGRAPVGPIPAIEKQKRIPKRWPGATGLAEDVRRYGAWMREEAFKRIGHLYPQVDLPKEHGGGKATVIAWLWARTVESPNPAFRGVHVPLVASFWLSKKKGRLTWVEPVVEGKEWRFEVRTGTPVDQKAIGRGTVGRSGATCLVSGEPIPFSFVRDEARTGRMGERLMAVVADGPRHRVYLAPDSASEALAASAVPLWEPDTEMPEQALGFRVQKYGMTRHSDLFTKRQALTLSTLASLVPEAAADATSRAISYGLADDGVGWHQGGSGAKAYGDAVATYLGMGVAKLTDYVSTLVSWSTSRDQAAHVFTRHALPMVWDFTEVNPFAKAAGDLLTTTKGQARAIAGLPAFRPGHADQRPAQAALDNSQQAIISTDPPYYDNVPYADLSDYFYVWLRRSLRQLHPALFRTLLVPKAEELIAERFRHGGRDAAERFFEEGMSEAVTRMALETPANIPVSIYYAFKASETTEDGTTYSGWDTFLQAVINAGFSIVGTWPIRTERAARTRSIGSNALASSIVLVCRKRPDDASTITRGRFRRLLRSELPSALRAMEKGSVAPVDLAQASIGPGMAVFSRHAAVLEADDSPMKVRAALQLIHEVMDELRGEEEGELDRDTRFAVKWFETHGYDVGPFGEAQVLATATSVSVEGVARAGICHAAAGKVRLLSRDELPVDWDPSEDERLTTWEATQYLIKRLEEQGEGAAATLLSQLGETAEAARVLAYRLYTVCERRGWAEEGRAYNGLVVAWPDLEQLGGVAGSGKLDSQASLFPGASK